MKNKKKFLFLIVVVILSFSFSVKVRAEVCGGRDPDICECLGKNFGDSCTVSNGFFCNKGGYAYMPLVKFGDPGVCRRGKLGSIHESLCCGAPDSTTVCVGKKQCDKCEMNPGINKVDGYCMDDKGYLTCTVIPSGATCNVGSSAASSSNCPTPCASNETCAKMASGSYECVAIANSSNCKTPCDSNKNETCVKMSSGSYECVVIAGSSVFSPSAVFKNPLNFNTVQELATNVLSTLRTVIVILSIIFIVLGGIFYITSAGNEKRMTAAKGAIFAAMIGLAIGIAAPSFLKEIYTILGGNASGINPPAGPSLTEIASNFLNFLLSVVGILALIMMIVGGIMYLISAGDDDRIKTAKKIITFSVIGIAISLASLVIVRQISNLLK